MPLLRIDVIEGRSEEELKKLLDAIHCAMLAAFKVLGTRLLSDCETNTLRQKMRIEDTGLGILRTERTVVVQVTARPRSGLEKQNPTSCCAGN